MLATRALVCPDLGALGASVLRRVKGKVSTSLSKLKNQFTVISRFVKTRDAEEHFFSVLKYTQLYRQSART